MSKTFRDVFNALSDEEFAQLIVDNGILQIACEEDVECSDQCTKESADCLQCVVKLLKTVVEGGHK